MDTYRHRHIILKVLKIAVGSCLAIAIAEFFALQYAASALHFKPVTEVEWQMIFYQRKKADIRVEIFAQGSASRTKKTDTGNL